MGLRSVLSRRALEALTPLRHSAWEAALHDLGLSTRYPNLVASIQFGFNAGIPLLTQTFTPPNSSTLSAFAAPFEDIVAHELATGRYLGPLSRKQVEALLGPFQSSPISLIPKPHKPNKYRVVQNLSFPRSPTPHHSSINFVIDSDDYPCLWGTFPIISLLVTSLPPGSEGACRDVKEAYRICPLAPSQWPGIVVRLNAGDSFAIDTCNLFGLSSGAGVYGSLADAGVDILRGSGIGPVSKWVDDHLLFRIQRHLIPAYNLRRKRVRDRIIANGGRLHSGGRYWFSGGLMDSGRLEEYDDDNTFPLRDLASSSPRSATDAAFAYCMADVDAITDALGIPWETSKDVPFSSEVPFTGLRWNLVTLRVSLPLEKRLRYLEAIQAWRAVRTHTLHEVQKLYGKLLHATLVLPAGRAYLTGLEAMLGVFHDRPHKPRTPPSGTPAELDWWADHLARAVVDRPVPGIVSVLDPRAFSDASSEVGIGVVIGDRWRAWRLIPGWKRDGREIGWAEAVGFELTVRILLRGGASDRAIKVLGDNQGVVEGWWNNRSRGAQVNGVFRRIHNVLDGSGCSIHTRYITSEHNPADGPSRGVYPSTQLLLPPIPIPLPLRHLIIDFDAPLLDVEVDLRRRRLTPLSRARLFNPQLDRSRAVVNDGFDACGAELDALHSLQRD